MINMIYGMILLVSLSLATCSYIISSRFRFPSHRDLERVRLSECNHFFSLPPTWTLPNRALEDSYPLKFASFQGLYVNWPSGDDSQFAMGFRWPIEIDGLPNLKWWIFPWQTVSHNQRVLSGYPLFGTLCSFNGEIHGSYPPFLGKTSNNFWAIFIHRSHSIWLWDLCLLEGKIQISWWKSPQFLPSGGFT